MHWKSHKTIKVYHRPEDLSGASYWYFYQEKKF